MAKGKERKGLKNEDERKRKKEVIEEEKRLIPLFPEWNGTFQDQKDPNLPNLLKYLHYLQLEVIKSNPMGKI